MFEKKIKINNVFKEWLGESPSLGDIWGIFGGATLATGLLFFGIKSELTELPLWRSILFILVSFDIIGGAIANFTESTDKYYSQNPERRLVFYAEHIVHLTLFYLATRNYLLFWLTWFLYPIVAGIIVDRIKLRRQQEIISSIFLTIGCIFYYTFRNDIPLANWFPAVFMIKIILGFAVRRTK
jgi:hypothetical protein